MGDTTHGVGSVPTKKPRFLVTIEPDHHRALKALAGISGVSVSGLINQLLEPRLRPFLTLANHIDKDPRQADLVEALQAAVGPLNAIFGSPPDHRGGEPPPPATPPQESSPKPSRGRAGSRHSAKPREQGKAK